MKKIAVLLLALIMVLSVCTVSFAEGEEDITVRILFPQNSSLRPAMDVSKVWDYIYENTGIHFDVQVLTDSDQLSLMLASRDYPDIFANVGLTPALMSNAIGAGDFVKLDDYFDTLLPNWKAFFEANPIIYNMEVVDGGLYTLPWVNQSPYERELRNQWLYNDAWLKELNLEVPTTTEEFKNVMLAIKEAAGTGTIPEGVVGFYYQFDGYTSGQFDIYGSFGVLCTSDEYLMVDPEGKVVSQAINPDIKAPLKYLQELYALGLTPPEAFTDDYNAYITKTSASPACVFSYSSFANRSPLVSLPMAPLDTGTGAPSYIRKQAYVANNRYCVAINANSPYAERLIKFLDWAIDGQNAVVLNYGMEGVVWDYNEDGKYQLHFWETNTDKMTENAENVGFVNSWFNALSKDLYRNFFFPESEIVGTREWAIDNLYPSYFPEWDACYVAGTLEEDDRIHMDELYADLKVYRQQTFARWITTNADIDAEWDAYVEEMMSFGHDEWLELKQKAYNLVAG